MDNRWCKIRKNVIDKRYSLRCIGVGVIFFAALYVLTKMFNCSLCPVKNFLGISCFGCGLTRAFICILEFDFISAIEYNVLSLPLFFGIVFYVLIFILDILLSKNNIQKIDNFLSKKYMYVVYIVALIISLYYNN